MRSKGPWTATLELVLICSFLSGFCASRRLPAQAADAVKNEFRDPGTQYRPMVRWWWPGGDVTDKELLREIGILDAAGFGGAEIQPFVTFDTRGFSSEKAAHVHD